MNIAGAASENPHGGAATREPSIIDVPLDRNLLQALQPGVPAVVSDWTEDAHQAASMFATEVATGGNVFGLPHDFPQPRIPPR